MKVFALVKNGESQSAFELQDRPTPQPGPGEILIRSEGFGLNFADVMARLGLYKDCPPLPAVIGYENVGHIQEIGEGVTGFQVGDRVLTFTRFGGYADHVISPAMAVAKIPDTLSVGEATALATQYITAYYAAEEVTNFYPGDHILIHAAAGGVGTALIQLLKHKGCVLFGTAGSAEKLDYLRNLGVDYPINYREEDYQQKIEQLGFGKKLDGTFNPVGGDYVKKDFALLNSGGRVMLYGASKQIDAQGNILKLLKMVAGFGFWSPIKFVTTSQSIIGINMLRVADNKPEAFRRCLSAIIHLYESGIVRPIVSREFPATELSTAHDYLGGRQSIGKVAIKW